MRLAFVGPLPPAATGIADYDADVLHALAGRHEIDAFHGQDEVDASRLPAGVAVRPASSLATAGPYDAVVYQMGNAPAHAFLYPLLAARSGLLVLHDLVLHHSRAHMLLQSPEALAYAADPSRADLAAAAEAGTAEYVAEASYSHPEAAGRLAAVHLGTTGRLLSYAYPLVRLPLEASRAMAAHNDYVFDAVRAMVPGLACFRVVMPVERLPVASGSVQVLRDRYGMGADEVVVGTFGLLTPEKQVDTLARAFARASALRPGLRLLLVGHVPDASRLERTLERHGVRGQAVVTGRVPFAELAAHMELAEVVAHLRYPTARETSAALLRVLAQGRPTVMTDLEHLRDIPEDAVLRADPADEEGAVTRALLRMAGDHALRQRLGARAAAFVATEHTAARCAASYEAALTETARLPDPPRRK